MFRMAHIGALFFLALFGFLFFASSPIREVYIVAPQSTEETVQQTDENALAGTESTPDITSVVSKITETVADLQKKVTIITNTSAPAKTLSPEEVNVLARAALVNIYCTTELGNRTRLVTGSGVMIDPRGIILTNAHVAQNFLFENVSSFGDTDCIIRAGSPASPFYDAEILYISPSWVKENATAFKEESPLGTGEHDFALLRITRSLRKDISLPEQFPFLSLEKERERISVGNAVLIASYPAGFLGSIAIQKDLYQTSTIVQIKDLFTFTDGSVELFSMGGNALSQKGSSGSAVVDLITGTIVGIVVTSDDGATTADRDLHAIIFSHMSESMKKDIGFSLPEFLAGDPTTQAASFARNVSPALLQILSQ